MSATTTRPTVSLNSDIGEGFGNWKVLDEETLLSTITDANVACGFHAGDPDTMARMCALAARQGVTVGAHVGFHDLRGFGRRYIAVPQETLANDVRYQIGALLAFASAAGTPLSYVKPHGALYHSAATRAEHAQALVKAMLSFERVVPVLCQTGSLLARFAEEAGIPVIAEGFMDRAYTASGTLLPRSEPGAVISDPELAAERAVQMVTTQTVTAVSGETIPMAVRSLCIHSDSPGAAVIARTVRAALEKAGVEVASAITRR
ncbi:LamB/YcsF family protein [Streptomyces tendae]|uniref:LamB/YcsF family protein n=1 Tax=Streptomyces tendae TaxID=1932 RepID=UPI0036BD4B61